MKLSILIPSLYSRREYLARLLACFSLHLPDVEILINIDNGSKSIGKKRNELLASAKGDYLVFIDDDDIVTENYIPEIMKGIALGVDHIGIAMLYAPETGMHKKVLCSRSYKWCEKDNIYYRSVQHVCPVKSSLAKQIIFPEINFGEDRIYSERLTSLCHSEYLIDEPIYIYKYRQNK